MKLIINVSGKPLSISSELKINESYYILSPFKGAKTMGSKGWTAIPYSYRTSEFLNRAFWIANYYIDKDLNGYRDIDKVILFTPDGRKDIKPEDMRIPFVDHYFKDTANYLQFNIAYKIWERVIAGESYADPLDELDNCGVDTKQLRNRLKKIHESDIKDIINGGNEGVLYFKTDKHDVVIKKSKTLEQMKVDLNQSSKNLGCQVEPAIEKIGEYYNFDVEISEDKEKNILFEYKNILLPTGRILYPLLINSLIKQKKLNIMIDDNKLENYAKYYIEGTRISRLVFADLGMSFIKVPSKADFDKNFFGIIRDHYYLGKNHKHHNCRQIIRDRRAFKSINEISDRRFKLFHDVVQKGYQYESNACKLESLPTAGIWKFCKGHINTVTKVWEKRSNRYLNLKNTDEDEIIKCNCHNLLVEAADMSKKPSFSLDESLSLIQDSWEIDFGPMVIALVTTTGKRDISKAIASIENQLTRVDKIVIASEQKIDSEYETLVNPYEKGLARNTMQALIRIKKQNTGKIFVATLDDDDEWKPEYIHKVSEAIARGKTFISSPLEVREEGKRIDTWSFDADDMTVKTFLYGNCGVQGSNKVFDLDIALESGGMPMGINASTDRAFNINMIMHPDTKVAAISEDLVIFNKDKRPDRITNDPRRLKELQNFYKHFWHLLDHSRIDGINKRHRELHGFDEVITWR